MIEWSLQFDAIHGIEHTGRAHFVGVLVEPPALLQRISAQAASELSDVEWARGRRIHAWTSCYCRTRPATSTPLSIHNGCMEAAKPHVIARRLITQPAKPLIPRAVTLLNLAIWQLRAR
jgi:hypothetical protein